jgi:hypothetical protein
MCQHAAVNLAILEILLLNAFKLLNPHRLKTKILAILHHVEQMLGAIMEFVLVIQNIEEILIKDVDRNVFLVRSVHQTKLVLETNVSIHVRELVGKMQCVMLSIMFHHALVLLEWREILLYFAEQHQECPKIPVILLHVGKTAFVKIKTDMLFVLVNKEWLEFLQVAVQSASSAQNVIYLNLAWIKDVSIHVLGHAVKTQNVALIITIQFVVVIKDIQETLLIDAFLKGMNQKFQKTPVFLHLVVQTQFVEELEITQLALVLKEW